ncbi:4-hydroxy-3-methylbut-2-enyl diphosphate reductase [Coraliomargarita akajimensis]|uniref:Hydroxymethylbutenyl pyrophosphate reductase n=1 Tax=Coraliomargarita akajimensis (strain DSM 45221 / IAM 15411 / JCM 23193 / KCTC 12865 / 04OKA010-24) TaxID=583355 RepID=D5ELG8_CORAD|nr:4-hydroxy-3-methylbut-2-enyl diphosphate reductase [Coraliomargarita akajimensis]ADE55104.1 hydroxymethylbutenyl pyrophosphate reductase [Coraliomargarita akajimensis DSM 45221]
MTDSTTNWILLAFDQRNRLCCTHSACGELLASARSEDSISLEATVQTIAGVDATSYLLDEVYLSERLTEIHVVHIQANEAAEFYSLNELESGALNVSDELKTVLQAIDKELVRIPYLDLGENEYIYRFRTAKERNRTIYIDEQSSELYQSQLCSVIKAARRTKEKKSGAPAVLDFGPVRYVIPSHFGFCLGVQNAIERAYEAVASNPGRRVFMLSELIHNPFVNEDLLARGLRYLQTDKGLPLRSDGQIAASAADPEALWNQLTSDDIVIIPAFGATNEDKARLIKAGLSIRAHDATCMLVEKVWKAARRYAQEGFTVLIHGKAEHEETKATFSNSSSHGPALMIRNMDHARALAAVMRSPETKKAKLFEDAFAGLYSEGFDPARDLEKIAVVNQTTLLRNETLKIIEYLRSVIAEVYGNDAVEAHLWSKGKGDTLCYATQVNQDALHKAVEEQVDIALVVGGRNSSNTYQLYRVCESQFGERAHYIQSEANILSKEQIRHYIFTPGHVPQPEQNEVERSFIPEQTSAVTILLTGGASCPDGIIQQVIHKINGFFPQDKLHKLEDILSAFEPVG